MNLDEVETRPNNLDALDDALGERPSLATTEFHEEFTRRYQQLIFDRGATDSVTYYEQIHCGSICQDPHSL